MSDNFENNLDDVEIPLENDEEVGDQGEGEPSSPTGVIDEATISTMEECHLSDDEVKKEINNTPSQESKNEQNSSPPETSLKQNAVPVQDVDLNDGGVQIVKKDEEGEDNDEEEFEYPDTNIQLQYVGGDM